MNQEGNLESGNNAMSSTLAWPGLCNLQVYTVVFRFKHIQFKQDFRFKQDFQILEILLHNLFDLSKISRAHFLI